MRHLFVQWLRLAPFAAALVVIQIGMLTMRGGATGSWAAGLGAMMMAVLIVAIAIAPTARLRSAAASNAATIGAFALFVLYTLFSISPISAVFAHPMYDALGLEGPVISLNRTRTLEGLAKFLGPSAAFGVGALAFAKSSDRDRAGRLIVIVGLIYGCAALADYLAELDTFGKRLDAGLGSANAAATMLGLFVLAALGAVVRASRGPERGRKGSALLAPVARAPMAFSMLFVALPALLLTASRGGVLATFAACLGFAGLVAWCRHQTNRRGAAATLLIVTAIFGLIVALGAQLLAERLAPSLDSSSLGRLKTFQVHSRAFLDRPWFGHGLNSFSAINTLYGDPENWRAISMIGAAHNIVLQHLEETGILGAVLFVGMLGQPILRTLSAAIHGGSGHAWSGFVMAATILVFVHGMVDFGMNVPSIAAFYALVLGAYSQRGLPRG